MISESDADRLALARGMGIDPLYLASGGKIIFVEGPSDEKVVSKWLALRGLSRDTVAVENLR